MFRPLSAVRSRPAAAFALAAPDLLMLLLRNCQIARDPLGCRLDAILKLLYVAAVLLFAVLLAVIWAAVRLYRKNRTTRIANALDEDD